MKKWAVLNTPSMFILGFLIWGLASLFLAQSFKTENIAIASFLFVFFNVMSLTLVEWFWFSGPLSYMQMVGLGLGMISCLLIMTA
jgi:multidrug transporter EmrE-like cation transporter